ncbi:hypothetical protein [Micromonospora sp. NPDC006431]|uniref:hypothetical protein n=1 Tax=Micromonospora sp. NPDC006431 TaxID=3364235 RepID=UPI0036BD67DC
MDAVALLAAVFDGLGLIGVACGGWMAVDARNSPEGMAGLAAYVMLMLSGMVAVGATTVTAVGLYARGSNRVATALGALAIAGVVGLFLLRLTA